MKNKVVQQRVFVEEYTSKYSMQIDIEKNRNANERIVSTSIASFLSGVYQDAVKISGYSRIRIR